MVQPLLMQVVAQARDTVITKTVVANRSFIEVLMNVSTIVLTLSLTVLAVFALHTVWRFRGAYRKVNRAIDQVQTELIPILRQAATVTDNVNYITTSVRADIALVNSTIASANDRLQQAVDLTEERLNEFNALLKVVQREAEDAFITTASTVRGVRTGAAVFRDHGREHGLSARGTDLASEDEVDPADVADELESQMESLEVGDGYDGDSQSESSAAAFSAAPRVRPRRGPRRSG